MENSLSKKWLSRLYKPGAFLIAALFSYGGVVNLGWSGFLCALPFLGLLGWMTWTWGKFYRVAGLILFLAVFLPLYVLKISGSSLYFPATGKTITLAEDACLYKLEGFLSLKELPPTDTCDDYTNLSIPAQRLNSGTSFTITRTDVSHPDFAQIYTIYMNTPFGELGHQTGIRGVPDFLFQDGTIVAVDDLRRDIFYTPSLLMFWPMTPFIVPALL